jgi:hypothetical protein
MSAKTKCPYTFAAKSRAAMTAYILDRRGYVYHHTRYPFSWNVKAHNVDWLRPKGECELDPAFDAAWEKYVERESGAYGVESAAFDDAQRQYADGERTSYPGDDQGDWKFGFYGRCGGHLCLESWRGKSVIGMDAEDIRERLAEMPFPTLRHFYRALVCMDSDFTPANASANVEHQVNFMREQWEDMRREERDAALADFVERMEADRPDLYAVTP